MKKTSLITFAIVSVMALTGLLAVPQAQASCNDIYISGETIRIGSRGPMVKRVQAAVNTLLDTHLKVDGIYGKNTARILKGLQKEMGIKVDGVIGKQTYMSLRMRLAKKCNANEDLLPEKKNYSHTVKTFSSHSLAESFVKEGMAKEERLSRNFGKMILGEDEMANFEAKLSTAVVETDSVAPVLANPYSKTNIQEVGVDESDIIKTDGEYIYTFTGKNIDIVKTQKDGSLETIKTIILEERAHDMYINGDTLVIFSNIYEKENLSLPFDKKVQVSEDYVMPYRNKLFTRVLFYDISNPEEAAFEKSYDFEGSYVDSRITNGYLYTISRKSMYAFNNDYTLPVLREDGKEKNIGSEIFYFDMPYYNYNFTQINGINLKNLDDIETSTYLLSGGNGLYASKDAFYLHYTYNDREIMPFFGVENKIMPEQKSTEKTVIHKINLHKGESELVATGSVPGHMVNRFAMSEYEGNLRVATTLGHSWGGIKTENNLYVLNGDLTKIGSIEGLAKGEKIYSARFVGDKAYLVTFKQIDPFFVINLSNPRNPKVEGELKIPGFSNYLHPYDKDTILGIGKDTYTDENGRVRSSGVKIALFDVSDVNKPREIDSLILGGKYASSEALYNHKAVLFSKEKNLLVIPYRDNGYNSKMDRFSGAAVLSIDKNEINLEGKITHDEGKNNWGSGIKRNLYIDDVLYSLSRKKLQSNEIDSLKKIDSVELSGDTYEDMILY